MLRYDVRVFMEKLNNVIKFPCLLTKKKQEMVKIRDDIETILSKYALDKNDLWAVSLAAGRFASINLEKFDGRDNNMDFFRDCIETQKKFELSRDSSNIS